MNNCKACGQELPEGVSACIGCGRPVEPNAPSPGTGVYNTANASFSQGTGNGISFVKHLLGLIPLALYLCLGLVLYVAGGSRAFSAMNIRNMFLQTAPMLPLFVAASLTVRARGLDLSLAAIFSLGALVMVRTGVVPALLATALCGLVSGVLIVGLRLPSVIVSLVTSAIYSGICLVATGAMPVMLEQRSPVSSVVFFTVPLLCLAGGFAYHFLTPLGLSQKKRGGAQDKMLLHLLAYPLAGMLAGVGGMLLLLRIGTYAPTMGGSSYYIHLALVWAALKSTGLADNRVVPVLYAALLAGIGTIYNNALLILGASASFQQIVYGVNALWFFVAAGIVFVVSAHTPWQEPAGPYHTGV